MIETDELVRDLLDRLEPATVERPEWDDVLARLERPGTLEALRPAEPRRSPGTSWWRSRTQRGVLVVGVAAVAAAIALSVTAPWRGGPTILERASAAIQSPSPTEVLYMSFETRRSGCCRLLGAWSTRLWVQGSTPRRFRAVFPGVAGPTGEGGGTLSARSVLTLFSYDPATNTLKPLRTGSRVSTAAWDPVAIVRDALAAGRARVRGKTTIGGKQAIRIEIAARDRRGGAGKALYYVDPKTYRPIELDYPHLVELRFPFEPAFGNGIYKVSLRFVRFTYLPATPATVKLANIRAMHPTATVR